jgi:hypothetical protein
MSEGLRHFSNGVLLIVMHLAVSPAKCTEKTYLGHLNTVFLWRLSRYVFWLYVKLTWEVVSAVNLFSKVDMAPQWLKSACMNTDANSVMTVDSFAAQVIVMQIMAGLVVPTLLLLCCEWHKRTAYVRKCAVEDQQIVETFRNMQDGWKAGVKGKLRLP